MQLLCKACSKYFKAMRYADYCSAKCRRSVRLFNRELTGGLRRLKEGKSK